MNGGSSRTCRRPWPSWATRRDSTRAPWADVRSSSPPTRPPAGARSAASAVRGRARRGPGRRPARQLVLHGVRESLVRLRPQDEPPVDEERRRGGNAVTLRLRRVLLDLGAVASRLQALVEEGGVEAKGGRALLEVGVLQLVLVAEEHVVHRPELALVVGAGGRLRGPGRVGMDLRQRVVAIHEADLPRIRLVELPEGGDGARAE